MKNIAILASGSGTNAENIYQFFHNGNRVRVKLVIYDRKNAGVAERMMKYPDVRTIFLPRDVWKEKPSEIVDLLKAEEIDLVVLAGFLRVIPSELTSAFAGRMINIHPSLLPAYGGMGMYGLKVHEAVIAAGEKKSGVTVHYVSDEVDGGEILMQDSLEVLPGDTPESLQSRIHEIEYTIFPRAIVAALNRLDPPSPPAMPGSESATETTEEEAAHPSMSMNPPVIEGVTPPASPAQEWAERLGMEYNPEKIAGTVAEKTAETQAPVQEADKPDQSVQETRQPEQPRPSSYLGWAIAMTLLCCLPTGIVAIIYSSQVNDKFHYGDITGAQRASDRAQIWIILSFVLGLLANTLMLPMMLIG